MRIDGWDRLSGLNEKIDAGILAVGCNENILWPAHPHTVPNQTKPNQTNPNKTKPNQTKPNQTKPNQIEPNHTKPNQNKQR